MFNFDFPTMEQATAAVNQFGEAVDALNSPTGLNADILDLAQSAGQLHSSFGTAVSTLSEFAGEALRIRSIGDFTAVLASAPQRLTAVSTAATGIITELGKLRQNH